MALKDTNMLIRQIKICNLNTWTEYMFNILQFALQKYMAAVRVCISSAYWWNHGSENECNYIKRREDEENVPENEIFITCKNEMESF